MSEHRRKQSNPGGTSPDRGAGQPPPRPQGGPPPRRTARPQGQNQTTAQPRMTRAEMRKAAQSKGRRGAGAANGMEGGPPGGGRGGKGPAGPSGPPPKRFIDYPRWGKGGVRRWLPSFKQILSGCLMMFAAVVGLVGYAYATTTVPPVNPSTQQQNNIFYWADGKTIMATTGTVNRQNVHLTDVPVAVQEDFQAAEDETFRTNSGVDPMSILRAVRNMVTGGAVQSGSTITQQWVKNSILANSSQTATRKFSEIMISVKIGQGYYTKDQVLEGYLNSNYYGRGANGIEAAAEAYYGVHAQQLTVSEGAFIAATVNQPSFYQQIDTDPNVKPQAIARWTYVLNRMVHNNWMTAADRAQYTPDKFPMPIVWNQNASLNGQVGYLVETAQNYVESHTNPKVTDAEFAKGGFRVYTTFDKKKIADMSAAVDKMQKDHLDPKKRPKTDTFIQTGAASIDPSTGAVVALYGGPGMDKGHFVNNANTSGVPVGSTFKPIVMAAALQNGAILTPGAQSSPITPDSKFNGDNGITIKNQQGNLLTDAADPTGILHQQNDDNTKRGFITLRTAMDDSVNTPYVQLGEDVGYSNVEKMATDLGLDHTILTHDTAGFYIGTSTPSAIRMANVYATFASGGIYHDPYSVAKLDYSGADQQPVLSKPLMKPVMTPSTANTINSMLQDVIKNGTATPAQVINRPAAGKTGTTDEYKSAWFIGYTPQLATAVTMFREDPAHPTLVSMSGAGGYPKFFGRALPLQVWVNYMSQALNGLPATSFPPAPTLGTGSNESGAPSPSASASASASSSASASRSAAPSTSPSAPPSNSPSTSPSATDTCLLFACITPSSSPTDTGSASPSSSRTKRATPTWTP
ncbi:membrane peptidoglycan carboxypeptidase [Streptacidiphilus sp. MAP12-16]|uniref:transglycosylase domain-containing protein n=1 Tax=Streptacidiphilus sp. MAP12-16 TaxID=3156300 RepID=UPI0035148003